jgi:nucleotide-binding universal stress UspA family protein
MTKHLFSNIIVAVSGSDASILAAKYAIVMAKFYRCRLSAVYVIDTATIKQLMLSKIFIQEESIEYEKSLEANGNRHLAFVEELALAKGIKIEKELRKGAVYTELVTAVDEKNADLLIMGAWEQGRNTRDILTHVHSEIMINSKCSVLLVKEPNIDQIYKHA